MLTVAQSVEHLIVIQKVVGSIPICQPKNKAMNKESKLLLLLLVVAIILGFIGGKVLSIKYIPRAPVSSPEVNIYT